MPGAIGPPRGCDDSNLGNAVLAIDLVGLNIDVIVTYATGVTESCTSKVTRQSVPAEISDVGRMERTVDETRATLDQLARNEPKACLAG
jgi:hypothetical protein